MTYKPKPIEQFTMEIARLRGWLKFIRDEKPTYIEQVATLALDTSHWADEAKLCPACNWPMPKHKMVCDKCESEEKDYKDEIIERWSR